ncbi:hypothetical protein RhiirB3_431149 [Rhizophagus irregularis]|nr:hypothetical protein RhiirB3_431149 [Rhizophagus irregularis]
MLKLNRDIIFLILKELQNDHKSFYSCLLVNRTWCEMAVPILWRDPAKIFGCCLNIKPFKNIFNVILSHLSEESRDYLKIQGIDVFKEIYHQPLFNYISFWKCLDLCFLDYMVALTDIEENMKYILGKKILKLFINSDSKFFSLSISELQYLNILGTEQCFSEIEYFYSDNNANSNILKGLAKINTSIKKLEFYIMYIDDDDHGIVRLIEVQKSLKEVIFRNSRGTNETYCKLLENSLITYADSVQYLRIDWKPITEFLSNFVNLVSLDLMDHSYDYFKTWNNLEKASFPLLKFLKSERVPPWVLANLIKNTKGHLIKINIFNYQDVDDGRLIKAIYQNCPKLNYLRLQLSNEYVSDFESLLINCQFLFKLDIIGMDNFNWNKLFDILTKFSPINLYKFTFSAFNYGGLKLESLKLFLDNWNERHPVLLEIHSGDITIRDLMKKYKTKGVIKEYVLSSDEWLYIQMDY